MAPLKKTAKTPAASPAGQPTPVPQPPRGKGPTMTPPKSGVKVRMYRQGLGDCFLLAYPTNHPDKAFYMLIDCGVILGTPTPADKMAKVASDIEEATGGDIHLLVATHEHWDHLSGFIQAGDIFGRLRVHKLWFAWTEDPTDALANKLRKDFGDDREALRAAVGRAFSQGSVEHLRSLVEFFGEVPAPAGGPGQTALAAAAAGDGKSSNTEAALTALRTFAKAQGSDPEYRHPGEPPLSLPSVAGLSVPGVRLYVLGPPHDEKSLRSINPTAKGQEVYADSSALTARTAFRMAAVPADQEDSTQEKDLRERSFPFDQRLRIPLEEAASIPFFAEHYGFEHHQSATAPGTPGPVKPPFHPPTWRRIDDDWLGAAGGLALQLDSFTNNTSLAMAIELIDSGKVLLFAADAQVGNWLSWGDLHWSVDNGKAGKKDVRIEDLLARTVLYKVGHHASHNATMRAKGLELMTSPDLVALVPVDENIAHNVKHWNQMPFKPLLTRLSEKARGRVLRVDTYLPDAPPANADAKAWAAFKKTTRAETGFFEHEVSG